MPIDSSMVSRRGFGRECEPLPRGRNTVHGPGGTRRHLGPRRAQATILGSIGIYSSCFTRSDIERDDRSNAVSRHISLRGRYDLAQSRAISSETTISYGYIRKVYETEISIAPRIVSARGDEREREPSPRASSSAPAQNTSKPQTRPLRGAQWVSIGQ